MNIKHIYIFSSYNSNGISSRYRGIYVLNEFYKNYKIRGSFIYPGYKLIEILNFIWAYLNVLFSFKKDIVVIYQKLHTKGIYTNLLKLLVRIKPKGSIYDTDDADYLRYNDKNILYFMSSCEMCTVGSPALKKFAEKYNDNVTLLTSPVISHIEIKEKKNKMLHIGWVGHYGVNNKLTSPYCHRFSLNEILFPALKELGFAFKFTMLGIHNPIDRLAIENYFKSKPNILLDIPKEVNWLDENSIYRRIAEFDVGVAPVVNHEFIVAKSAFKVKQYLSSGVPVLASPVGENKVFVKDEANGFICKDSAEFKNRIIQINNMPEEEYDKLRTNTLLNLEEYSMSKYCSGLLNGIR